MDDGSPEPLDCFEAWFLSRMAQVVEAGEVPSSLLTELQAKIEAARDRPQEESHAEALRDIAQRLGIPLDQVEQGLKSLAGR